MESIAEFELRMDKQRLERNEWWKELDRPHWEKFVKFIEDHRKAVEKGIN